MIMSILNLENMSTSEKFMAMEKLWNDMSSNSVDIEQFIPTWHLDVLDRRKEKAKNGDSKFFNIEDVTKEYLDSK